MPFKDYSTSPTAITTIGDGTFVGPNMPRDNVRPALQRLAADGRDLYNEMIARLGGSDLPYFILSARDFGAQFNGATDDTSALQQAINAAHSSKYPLHLPGGTALISAPLDLRGKEVTIVGPGVSSCTITATAPMESMLNIAETADQQFLRLNLSGFTLNGTNGGVRHAAHGYDMRYRHNTAFRDMLIVNCTTALRERDTWNNYRENVRSVDCLTGFNLAGSNHSSMWVKCGANGSTSLALYVGNEGTAVDGNYGLKFDTCNFDFNAGVNIRVAAGTSPIFDNVYFGENAGTAVLENYGSTILRGCTMYLGFTAGGWVRPAAGDLVAEYCEINGQGSGNMQSLAARQPGDTGTVAYRNCRIELPNTAAPITGAPFGPVPGTRYAPANGRSYSVQYANGATANVTTDGDALVVTITSAGTGGLISISAPLNDDWSRSGDVYLLTTYSATVGVLARLSSAVFGTPQALGTLATTAGVQTTLPLINTTPAAGAYTVLEYIIPTPTVGGVFRLERSDFSDWRFQNRNGSPIGNLGVIA